MITLSAQEYDAEQEARTLQALKEQQIQKIEQAAQRFRKQQAGNLQLLLKRYAQVDNHISIPCVGINSDQEASLWDSILTYTIQHLRVWLLINELSLDQDIYLILGES